MLPNVGWKRTLAALLSFHGNLDATTEMILARMWPGHGHLTPGKLMLAA